MPPVARFALLQRRRSRLRYLVMPQKCIMAACHAREYGTAPSPPLPLAPPSALYV